MAAGKPPPPMERMMIIKIDEYNILIDDEDYERVKGINWHLTPTSCGGPYAYRSKRINGKCCVIYLHRFIINVPDDKEVDHINGDTLDNRKANLRICNKEENAQNKGMQSNNTSGYKGVFYENRRKKWRAKIDAHGKRIHLGYFEAPEEAYASYCEASKKYHGEFGRVK
jgi:hypothetical protein